MKKWAIPVAVLSLVILMIAFYSSLLEKKDLKFTEADIVTPVMGLSEGVLSLKDLMKNTDQVVLGKVTGRTTLNEDREVFKVTVEEKIIGEVPNEILVYVQEDLLKEGEKYLLFLQPYLSTLYDKDFYTLQSDFIINVDSNNKLNRLVNFFEEEFIAPFEEDKYNHLRDFAGFLKKNYKGKKSPELNVKDFTNYQDLYKEADYVIEIRITNVDNVSGVAIVDYDLIKKYKGKDKEFNLILPTKEISKNESYLLFLTSEEDSYRLSTREGSIVKIGTDKYDEAIYGMK